MAIYRSAESSDALDRNELRMIPASSDLTIYQGDSFSVLFRVRASVFNAETQTYSPGDYVDLTGATAKSQIRATAASATVVEEFTPTIGAQSGDTLDRKSVVWGKSVNRGV